MTTPAPNSCIPQIGAAAGIIWKALSGNGSITVAKLKKQIDQPADTIMLALGWLAREEKIEIVEKGRSRIVSLS